MSNGNDDGLHVFTALYAVMRDPCLQYLGKQYGIVEKSSHRPNSNTRHRKALPRQLSFFTVNADQRDYAEDDTEDA